MKKNSRLSISDTEWPKVVADFCLDKPICREAPGETVSISYGERAEKYIRQFSVEEIYNFFMIKYPDFPRKLTVFRTLIPKNLVAPTLRDVKGNICPLHENVTRAIRAFNRFSQKNKVKDLSLPKSTIDICLKIICNPFPNDPKENRNPLNWDVKCTTGVCELCGLRDWLMSLSKTITDKKDGLEKKKITFSSWVRALGSDGKKKQILKQDQANIIDFVKDILIKALVGEPFPEHLRKAWNQWHITEVPMIVPPGSSSSSVALRTREDYQEDIKFLCTSETVSTHRGHGVITMLCYPVVIDIFNADGSKELHGLIFMSNSKNKNFDTVNHFEEETIKHVKAMGKEIVRYQRITDGCTSQFWCYGSNKHLEDMPGKLQIPLVEFQRLERYEGENMSDALGSLLKRKMRTGALQSRKYDDNIMDEINESIEPEDLVFEDHSAAFAWIDKCFRKKDNADTNFSKNFKSIDLLWIDDNSIPKNLIREKDCRKVKSLKKYNSAISFIDKPGIYLRDSTCSFCENCANGNVLECTECNRNGHFVHHVVDKSIKVDQNKRSKQKLPKSYNRLNSDKDSYESDSDDSDGSDDEEFVDECSGNESDTVDSEFEADDSEDEEEEEEEILSLEELTPGHYVLYKVSDTKHYVSFVMNIDDEWLTLKGARIYGKFKGKVDIEVISITIGMWK